MGDRILSVFDVLTTCRTDGSNHPAPFAAFADGPVADTAEPLAAEPGRPVAEPDGDDTDTVAITQTDADGNIVWKGYPPDDSVPHV